MGANRKSLLTWVERELLASPAWKATTNMEKFVYGLFLIKRTFTKAEKTKKGLNKALPKILNDGKIQFTYKEAKEKYGISSERFSSAIDGLVSKGFIVIARPGAAQKRIPTLFGFSDEWKKYGTKNFSPQKRPKNIWHKPKKFQGERFNSK